MIKTVGPGAFLDTLGVLGKRDHGGLPAFPTSLGPFQLEAKDKGADYDLVPKKISETLHITSDIKLLSMYLLITRIRINLQRDSSFFQIWAFDG